MRDALPLSQSLFFFGPARSPGPVRSACVSTHVAGQAGRPGRSGELGCEGQQRCERDDGTVAPRPTLNFHGAGAMPTIRPAIAMRAARPGAAVPVEAGEADIQVQVQVKAGIVPQE